MPSKRPTSRAKMTTAGSGQLPNNVRRLREARKWTQYQLAQISRLSERTIQRIESGGRIGQTAELALANAFELEISALYQTAAANDAVGFTFLKRLTTGAALLDLVEGAEGSHGDVEHLDSHQTELVSDLMTSIGIWDEQWEEIEAGQRVKARQRFTELIAELAAVGVWVFGTRASEKMPDESEKQMLRLAVLKAGNPRIIRPKTLREFGDEMCGVMHIFKE